MANEYDSQMLENVRLIVGEWLTVGKFDGEQAMVEIVEVLGL